MPRLLSRLRSIGPELPDPSLPPTRGESGIQATLKSSLRQVRRRIADRSGFLLQGKDQSQLEGPLSPPA